MAAASYTEEDIKTLNWREHIRLRPGMYIGKLGDGSMPDDGIYVLFKEAIDNCVDEFVMGHGSVIEIALDGDTMEVRDYGRGIPLGKLMDCAARINTGAKYDSEAFKKSVGLNGVGIKAVNALSSFFEIQAFRGGETKAIEFSKGEVVAEMKRVHRTGERDGTRLAFTPDRSLFGERFAFRDEFIARMLRYYAYLNPGLTLVFNGEKFRSKNGLADLLAEEMDEEPLYPVVHLKGDDIEVAVTHGAQYGEEVYSFVNGQHTTQGGTHLAAFREALVKTVRDHFKKPFEAADVREGLIAAVSIKVVEPVFESQTKTKLGSALTAPEGQGGQSLRAFVGNFLQGELDNYLHRHKETAKALLEKVQQSERERKELKGVQKLSRERARKAKVHNRKLRDCRVHFCSRHRDREASTVFLTEGDSASGSITKVRDVETQAVFSLRGKPLNTYGLTRKVVYENEEFSLLQAALDIEEDLDDLRYNRVVLATDADVDGMHIRLLLLTFFIQFFPELVKRGHLFILQTPLFRVRNRKETRFCYSEGERDAAVRALGKGAEITRFKGLGEISPDEFKHFIGPDMRLERVSLDGHPHAKDLLAFYMGKNTPERQEFIIGNLRLEAAVAEVPADGGGTGDTAAGAGGADDGA